MYVYIYIQLVLMSGLEDFLIYCFVNWMFSIVLVRRDETLPLTRSWLFPLYCGEFLPLSLSFATSEEKILVKRLLKKTKNAEKIRSENELKESLIEASLLEIH